ncbi:CdaR family transcriptional regulator [Nakamurella sp. YIM 132087]|uniref:CdaR family transcriptional regulator n=1 Tax=Nakamurella alba TaxID=2665158 RepID=A0A7K1FEC3_9ACTN|nr:helix-turn-helix domain-containing protein [Nakamurella alba]MTD12455.1 CdaR family transcriptional regulator [Nakamurella alba]
MRPLHPAVQDSPARPRAAERPITDRSGPDQTQARLRALEARCAADDRLQRLTVECAGLAGMVAACAELTGKPVVLFDSRHRVVAAAGGGAGPERHPVPALDILLGAGGPVSLTDVVPVVIPADPVNGPPRRALVTPVAGLGDHFGWLVVDEHRSSLRALDDFVARRISQRLAAEYVAQRRVAKVAWNARAALTRQLVHGSSDPGELKASGEYLGVDVAAQRICVYVRCDRELADSGDELADVMERGLDAEVLITRGSEGILLLCAVDPATAAAAAVTAVKNAVTEALSMVWPGSDVTAGVSGATPPDGLRRAYREAREVGLCLDRFGRPGVQRVLSVGDLGPARLFLANGGDSAVRDYADDILGPLLSGDGSSVDLLATLAQYFDAGRSIRLTATRLGIHENTVRLRLNRVHVLTGMDVAGDPNDQLGVQTALLVVRLQGHPAFSFVDQPGRTVRDDHGEQDGRPVRTGDAVRNTA